jgi:putative MFS transporter
MSQTSVAVTRSQRLDRLPFTRLLGKLIVGSGVGWAMDAMDVGLVSFILVALPQAWGVTVTEKSWLASAGFAGMAIGASVGGLLADRFGRRHVFTVTLLIYGLATGASALAWSMAALIGLRFVVGLGLGAELPVASTLVSEFSPPRLRGRIIVWLEAFWAVGWTLAAVIGYFVADRTGPFGESGWRVALALGAVPALYAVVVRRALPESVRFLESKGRHAEAEQAVEAFERSSRRLIDAPGNPAPARLTPPAAANDVNDVQTTTIAGLFGAGLRKRTIAIWTVWFCVNFSYYGAFTWLPTILAADLGSTTKSLQYTLIITLAQLPGYATAAVLIEKWGRRATLATFLAGSALAAGLFSQAATPATLIGAGMLLSFFNLGAWGALYAVTPEIYPTVLRGTGAGWAAGFGRVASILAPLIAPLVFTRSTAATFVLFAAFFLIAAAGALNLPEMRGRVLDETVRPAPEVARAH